MSPYFNQIEQFIYHRVEHKKLLKKSFLLGFKVSQFTPGGTFYVIQYYRIFNVYELSNIKDIFKTKKEN